MRWRPEGWVKNRDNLDPRKFVTCESSFEAGADTMLELLKKQPTSIKVSGTNHAGYFDDQKAIELAKKSPSGTWVFLPDEETDAPTI